MENPISIARGIMRDTYERVANLFTLLPILFEISPSYRYRKQVWGEKVK